MTAAAIAARSRPYLSIDVLDDLLAPLVLEIDVDVGRLVALLADEALEQHVAARGIDFGDAQAIAHRRVGRRPAALAQDVLAAREAHDVVDRQEVRLVPQLARSAAVRARSAPAPRAGCRAESADARRYRFPAADTPRGVKPGRHELVGIFVAQLVQRKRAALQRCCSVSASACSG